MSNLVRRDGRWIVYDFLLDNVVVGRESVQNEYCRECEITLAADAICWEFDVLVGVGVDTVLWGDGAAFVTERMLQSALDRYNMLGERNIYFKYLCGKYAFRAEYVPTDEAAEIDNYMRWEAITA